MSRRSSLHPFSFMLEKVNGIAHRRFKRRVALLLALLLVEGQIGFARVDLKPCKNNFTPEQQIQLGQKAAQQVYKEMPVLPDSSRVTQYISQLGLKLASFAPGYRWPYNFHVANVAEINAFALPGGTVFVNLGTIQAADTEAQLAGVMAHEISHVVLQHSVCNAAKQQKVGIIAGLGQVAADVLLGGAAGGLAAQGIGMTAGLGFLKMSRGAEREADLLGVQILYDAGYDPRGMPQFFEIIQSKYGAGGSQFMSDHPNPGNRTEYTAKEIDSFPPRATYIKTSPQFADIHPTRLMTSPCLGEAAASSRNGLSITHMRGCGYSPTGFRFPPGSASPAMRAWSACPATPHR